MARKTNPPIRGHELISEGAHWRRWDGVAVGGCRCGAQPDRLLDISNNEVKRWHRQHKAEIRAQEVE